MDDLKLCLKNEDQIDSLVNKVNIFFKGHQNGVWDTKVWIMNRGKRVRSEGISMPDGKMIKDIEESGYKYLGILEADGVKHYFFNWYSLHARLNSHYKV